MMEGFSCPCGHHDLAHNENGCTERLSRDSASPCLCVRPRSWLESHQGFREVYEPGLARGT